MFGNSNLSPEVLMALGGGILGGQNLAQGAGAGLMNASSILSQQNETRKQETKQATSENATRAWLQKMHPNQDFSQVPSEMLRYAAAETMKAQYAKPEGPDYQFLQAGDRLILGDKTTGNIKELGNYSKPAELPASAKEYEYAKSQGYKGSFEDFRNAKNAATPQDQFKNEMDVMKTYRAEDAVKNYQVIRGSYERMKGASKLGTGQGDIAIIYSYMKMLDPTSVVREGEYATAQNTSGVPETILARYNQLLAGDKLTPDQRNEFIRAAKVQFDDSSSALNEANKRYQGLADQYQIPTERFMEKPSGGVQDWQDYFGGK